MSKTYTSLLDLPDVRVDRCSQILANKLQCWRAGDVLVTEDTAGTPPAQTGAPATPPATQPPAQGASAPSTPAAGAAPKPAAVDTPAPPKTYQLCQMHATINKRADEASAKLGPPKEGEKSPLDKMLGVDLKYRTTVPPHAKEELRRREVMTNEERLFEDMMNPDEDSKEYKEFQKEVLGESEAPAPPPAAKAPAQTQSATKAS